MSASDRSPEALCVGRTLRGIHTAGASLLLSFADGLRLFCRPVQESGKKPRLAFIGTTILPARVQESLQLISLPPDAQEGLGRVVLAVEERGTGIEFSFDDGYKLFVSPVEGIQFTKDGAVLGAGVN